MRLWLEKSKPGMVTATAQRYQLKERKRASLQCYVRRNKRRINMGYNGVDEEEEEMVKLERVRDGGELTS